MEKIIKSKDIYNKLIGKPLEPKTSDNYSVKQVVTDKNIPETKSEIAIILSHANTPERKQMLNECLKSIKIDKIISSNCPVDIDSQNLADWLLYDKSNDLLFENEFEEYGVSYYHWRRKEDGSIITKNQTYEHGYAVYNLIKNALLFCKSIGKNIVHVINYDYLIPNDIIIENSNDLNDNDLIMYDQTAEYKNVYCTGLFSGKIDYLLKFFQYYTNKRQYYSHIFNNIPSTMYIEGKMYIFYKSSGFKIKEKKISELKEMEKVSNDIKIDRETLIRGTIFESD
jgi:hypothetical protein